jgi:exopolysaccharide biosynthesis protein
MKILSLSLLILFGGYFFYNHNDKNFKSSNCEIRTVNANNYVKLDGEITIVKINKGKMRYKVTNKDHKDFDFYVNANYFDKNDIPLGEVKINGKNITKKRKNGGFFTTNGMTPKFYFNQRPENVLYSSQTHTPVIINGKLNSVIFNKAWARGRLPRLIVGENKNGDIMILFTVNKCRMSIHELSVVAKKEGVINGLMFDGGASIEVGIKDNQNKYHYQIVNDADRLINHVPTPKTFIVGEFIN